MAIKKKQTYNNSLAWKSLAAEAYDLYRRMEKRTDVIIRKIIGFNTSCDWDDYRQEAYFACLEALNRYRQLTNMTLETFAFWYISNRLARMADTGDVCFTVVNGDGDEVGRLTNSSWRKSKTSLQK